MLERRALISSQKASSSPRSKSLNYNKYHLDYRNNHTFY